MSFSRGTDRFREVEKIKNLSSSRRTVLRFLFFIFSFLSFYIPTVRYLHAGESKEFVFVRNSLLLGCGINCKISEETGESSWRTHPSKLRIANHNSTRLRISQAELSAFNKEPYSTYRLNALYSGTLSSFTKDSGIEWKIESSNLIGKDIISFKNLSESNLGVVSNPSAERIHSSISRNESNGDSSQFSIGLRISLLLQMGILHPAHSDETGGIVLSSAISGTAHRTTASTHFETVSILNF